MWGTTAVSTYALRRRIASGHLPVFKPLRWTGVTIVSASTMWSG